MNLKDFTSQGLVALGLLGLLVSAPSVGHSEPLVELPGPGTPGAQSASFEAIADTYILRGRRNANEGASEYLRVRRSGANRALVDFDFEAVSATIGGGQLLSATLVTAIENNRKNWGKDGRYVSVHALKQPWKEGDGWTIGATKENSTKGSQPGATWRCAIDSNTANQKSDCPDDEWEMGKNNKPELHPFAEQATDAVLVTNESGGELEWDVTPDVAKMLAGETLAGWIIKREKEVKSGRVQLASREHPSLAGPQLVITYAPAEVALNPTQDTYLRQGSGNTNEGGSTFLRVRASGNNRALIQFDLSSLQATAATGATLTATLELSVVHNAGNWGTKVDKLVSAHALTMPWLEGNGFVSNAAKGTADRGDGMGATWKCAVDTDIANQKPDCEYAEWEMGKPGKPELHPWVLEPTDSVQITSETQGIVSWDVSEDVQAVLEGEALFGWVLRKDAEGQSGLVEFASKEHPSIQGPRLTVSFTP